MSRWRELRNGEAVPLDSISDIPGSELFAEIVTRCENGERPVAFYAVRPASDLDHFRLHVVLADDERATLAAASTLLPARGEAARYPSLTPYVPSFQLFEREVHEETGLVPEGHPWLKPVRYPFGRAQADSTHSSYPFFDAGGEGSHEVAVGPVHAGVIEPGHFRFLCRGETVDHLEIQLGYQHRGVEALFGAGDLALKSTLAEEIAGDSTVAHTTAYSMCIEALAGREPDPGVVATREAALELERIATHLGTLSALAGDVAHLTGASLFAATRTTAINAVMEICGSRFGRGWIRPGLVLHSIDKERSRSLEKTLASVEHRVRLGADVMLGSPSVLSRFQGTGRVSRHLAEKIGMVGLTARASGRPLDVRCNHPAPGQTRGRSPVRTLDSGDVFARAQLRLLEIDDSISCVRMLLSALTDVPRRLAPIRLLMPNSLAVALVEGHRGEIVHSIHTDGAGGCARYKVKDPSFNNWQGLALAVRGEGISDFPLCNKSFDLSYAGFDL